MKKIIISFLLFCSLSIFSQQIPRNNVIVEIGTATWSGFDVGAALGALDLVNNGHDVGIIAYHSGDDFENTYSQARVSYYGIGGFLTAYFDGILDFAGGGSSSLYNSYLPLYNDRIALLSSYNIAVAGTNSGLDYNLVGNLQ